jgi:hypothetical protein
VTLRNDVYSKEKKREGKKRTREKKNKRTGRAKENYEKRLP